MKNRTLFLVIFLAIFTLLSSVTIKTFGQTDLDKAIEDALLHAQIKLDSTIKEISNDVTKYPSETDIETLKWDDDELRMNEYWWTSGYFPACYWMMYQLTQDDKWKTFADKWTWGLEGQKLRSDNGDMAGIIYFSFGNGYKYTQNDKYLPVIDQAAKTYTEYFKDDIGAIKCWESGWSKTNHAVVTDFLIYSEFMFSAYQLTGNERYYEVVTEHIDKTMKYNIREDGSTWQFVDFNSFGDPIGYINSNAYQGWQENRKAKGTRWTRAQAWAINGLTQAYRYTRNKIYLDNAIAVADFFIDNLPDDFVPPSDFDAPMDAQNGRDVTAAAIACSGLLELSGYAENDGYLQVAHNILTSLCSPEYLTVGTNYSSILKRGQVRHSGPEIGIIYGDYYFLEAIAKYKGLYKYFMEGQDVINFAPSAVISHVAETKDSDLDGQEEVSIVGKYSRDKDGDIVSFQWLVGNTLLGTGDTYTGMLPVGNHVVSLVVTDNLGKTDTSTVDVVISSGFKNENIAIGKTIASSNAKDTNPATNLIDGADDTFWEAVTLPQWIEIDLGEMFEVEGLEIESQDYFSCQYIVEAMNEIGQYVVVNDNSTDTFPSNHFADIFESTTRYIKISFQSINGSEVDPVSISEIKVFGTNVPVTSIDLSEEKLKLKIGESHQLKATIMPENATDNSITWASTDTLIASVDAQGYITAIAAGSVQIHAMSATGKINSVCELTVDNSSGIHMAGTQSNIVQIYPNPVGTQLIFNIPEAVSCSFNLKIYDLLGKEVLARSLTITVGKKCVLQIQNNMSPGVYSFCISVDNKIYTGKFVKN